MKTSRVLALLLLGASTPAWASYIDGAFGLVMLVFAGPSALGALGLGALLRGLGAFNSQLGQRLFQALVAVPAGLVMVWALLSGDRTSTAMVWLALPLLAVLATLPSWWGLPNSGPPFWAPHTRLRHALALYWILTALLPLVFNAGEVLQPLLRRAGLAPGQRLLVTAGLLLLFGWPRAVCGGILLRRWQGALPWLTAALWSTSLLGATTLGAWALFPEDVPPGWTFGLFVVPALLLTDLGVWTWVRRESARSPS